MSSRRCHIQQEYEFRDGHEHEKNNVELAGKGTWTSDVQAKAITKELDSDWERRPCNGPPHA